MCGRAGSRSHMLLQTKCYVFILVGLFYDERMKRKKKKPEKIRMNESNELKRDMDKRVWHSDLDLEDAGKRC